MTDHQHEDNCLMCAVRALTEGDPPIWRPMDQGDTVAGVVLRMGAVVSDFGFETVPFVDLWQGGHQRVRVVAYGTPLRHGLDAAAPMIGDRLQVSFDGTDVVPSGEFAGRPYKTFTVGIQRGH